MVEVVKETCNEYCVFVKEITTLVSQMMGEEYTTRILKVTKNNSLELDSLVLLKEGKNFAPNIYILPYYEAFLKGTSIKELADRLVCIYHKSSAPITEENFTFKYEELKTSIIFRLVNYEKNKKLLEQVPHIRYLDLAVTFHCLVHNDKEGIGTIRITKEHLALWKVSLKELQECAARNTRKRFPPQIRSMEEVIRQLMTEDIAQEEQNPELQLSFFDEVCTTRSKMYILSNSQGINGATSLIYLNVLKEFSEQINSDLFILPSSIHEVILVPYDRTISKDSLIQMVKEVNRTQVAFDEVLSDSVYYFSRENNAISF